MANSLNEAFADLRTAAKELQSSVLHVFGLRLKPKPQQVRPLLFPECIKATELRKEPGGKYMGFDLFESQSMFINNPNEIESTKEDIKLFAKKKLSEIGLKLDFCEWLIIDTNGRFLQNDFSYFMNEQNCDGRVKSAIAKCRENGLFYFFLKAHADSNIFEGYIPPCQQ